MPTFYALFTALVALAPALIVAWAVRYRLTETAAAPLIAMAIAAAGLMVALLVFLALRSRRRAARWVALGALAVCAAVPVSWFVWPARILYAGFGLTVYGVLPVPVFDTVIDHAGLLHLREKSHRISRDEVATWMLPGVTDVVIGAGWDEQVVVDERARGIAGVRVHVLRTPEAIRTWEELRRDGRRAVLILHSTC